MTFSPFHPCPGIVWLFLGVFLYPPADINVGAGGGRIQERRAKENEEPLISGSAFLRFRSSPHSPHPDRLFFSLIWMGMESEPPSRADSSLQESHKQDKALLSPQPQVQKDRGAVKGRAVMPPPLRADHKAATGKTSGSKHNICRFMKSSSRTGVCHQAGNSVSTGLFQEKRKEEETCTLLTPGLDNTRLFMSLTAGAGT
jgi:hypothetical protein